MSRTKKKPDYDADRIMRGFMEVVADAFGEYDDRVGKHNTDGYGIVDGHDSDTQHSPSLNAVATEFGITALKARKLLITAGVYSTETSRTVQFLCKNHTIQEIMTITNLSRASVHSYLPYTKIPYKLEELSVNAERTKLYRERKRRCIEFSLKYRAEQEAELWELLEYMQGCVFYTAKGLKFTYKVKGGELFVNRKSKSITEATVMMAFRKCMELEGVVTEPKKLGTFGASYLYPVFVRIGVIKLGDME